jgi:hypothetical protein
MDMQATKIELASFILDLQNPQLVEKIKNLIYGNVDFYDELTEEQKESVQIGIAQTKEGKTSPWKEVEQLLKQR